MADSNISYIFEFPQEVKDIYLFGIVSVLLGCDIVFMLPPTIISSSMLRREERELLVVSYHLNI